MLLSRCRLAAECGADDCEHHDPHRARPWMVDGRLRTCGSPWYCVHAQDYVRCVLLDEEEDEPEPDGYQ